jgi:hypothetical protein
LLEALRYRLTTTAGTATTCLHAHAIANGKSN